MTLELAGWWAMLALAWFTAPWYIKWVAAYTFLRDAPPGNLERYEREVIPRRVAVYRVFFVFIGIVVTVSLWGQ